MTQSSLMDTLMLALVNPYVTHNTHAKMHIYAPKYIHIHACAYTHNSLARTYTDLHTCA